MHVNEAKHFLQQRHQPTDKYWILHIPPSANVLDPNKTLSEIYLGMHLPLVVSKDRLLEQGCLNSKPLII